jgi:hypothetical protein
MGKGRSASSAASLHRGGSPPPGNVNYLGDDETDDALAAAYGSNYRRLQKIKAHYDPTNFFRMNQNITPQH